MMRTFERNQTLRRILIEEIDRIDDGMWDDSLELKSEDEVKDYRDHIIAILRYLGEKGKR